MNSSFHPSPPPTLAEVERIASLSAPVVRNLQITQCYHELSAALVERTGGNANWCTFAAWASKQAGLTIRKEDLKRLLEEMLDSAPEPALAAETVTLLSEDLGASRSPEEIRRAVWQSIDLLGAVERASRAVEKGNQKVFAEIGREFARFIAACLADTTSDPEKIAQFCAGLRPGDPPEGQAYLRQAFAQLYEALFEEDGKRRAELLLLANLEIGFHEQTRLQPEIQAAMEAPFLDEDETIQRLLPRLFPRWKVILLRLRWGIMRLLGRPPAFERAVRALLQAARLAIRRILTEIMMAIRFSQGVRLRLWKDLEGEYPADLRQLTHPGLCSFLEQIDPALDSLKGSGAADWADLSERLHFIAELFRLYQQNGILFEPPFTDDQVEAIKAGRVPEGRL